MERFAHDLCSPEAKDHTRLRLLQWALYGLVQQLDEERVYGGGWVKKTAAEIHQEAPNEKDTNWAPPKEHLKQIGSL
jgi:hypothetical protein